MIRRPSRRALLALVSLLALLATACGGTSVEPTESAAPAIAEPAQAESSEIPVEPSETPLEASLVAATLDGGQIDFASLEGQDVVLWFWAPW